MVKDSEFVYFVVTMIHSGVAKIIVLKEVYLKSVCVE